MSDNPGLEDAAVERPAMELLSELGWKTLDARSEPRELGRQSRAEVVLGARLLDAVRILNVGIDDGAVEAAVAALIEDRLTLDPVRANQAVWELLRDGFTVPVERADGIREPQRVEFIDWNTSDKNDWLAVQQLTVTGDMHTRRTDIVLFVNGIPLGFLELKAPDKPVYDAYQGNLRAYRAEIPQLFWFNGFVILSNGSDARMGAAHAPWEHFAEWKKLDDESEPGVVSLDMMLRATCEPRRMLDIVENFTTYTETGGTVAPDGSRTGGLVKKIAKNHQYLGVNNALEATYSVVKRDGRLGVFWHTQGSGKSLSMLWFTKKVLRKRPGNWTFVLVTDRKELDEQLYEEFADSGVITSGVEVHATSSAHLRELLGQDHRYVFTLIHKFQPEERGADMPVLSERDDIIVITDEAHRSQYDTLAANMRAALPNASFLGFTGTPLIEGEEQETRRVFGDYVSIYNFADSIRDGATVPLYYENRIPELQLTNEHFDDDLDALLEAAQLDEAQDKAVARKFSQQHQLITRPKRLEEIAADLVEHFVNRGFLGKGMYVAIDKATAVRMYDLVTVAWQRAVDRLQAEIEALPRHERGANEFQLRWMRDTEMAVVVSQAQNEVADLAEAGVDIVPHRRKMNAQDLETRFKDPADPFRLVFVCAMWLTGFDAPSTSTIYLDKPMRGHTLMQTIARANRVFPDKDNGLIVDYIGVFRNLEKALAIYGIDRAGGVDTPIRPTDDLVADLDAVLTEADEYLARHDIEPADLVAASGFEYVNLLDAAVEALLVDEASRRGWIRLATRVRNAYKALMPDPAAIAATKRVSIVRNIANKIAGHDERPDISHVMDGVSELLDQSVGTREYIIRSDGEQESLLDLNRIDWEQLALTFAAKKRTAAKAVERTLVDEVDRAVRKNPTVVHLAERLRQLIDEYNAGTLNAEEYLRRLARLHGDLDAHQQRVVTEELSEAELAIFDLLTMPAPELGDAELRKVRNAAKRLLEHVEEALVLDWKKKEQAKASLRVTIRTVLNDELPDAYEREIFDEKRHAVYEHLYASFGNEGESIYDEQPLASGSVAVAATAVQKLDVDARLALLAEMYGATATWALPTEELISSDEVRSVEFKETARWNVREERKDKLMEDVVAKTVAGFLNGTGGTLLIGVDDSGRAVGLDPDLALVKPANLDGYVNWLDTMLENALGHAGAHRVRIAIDLVESTPVCRVDVPASSRPIWAEMKGQRQLFERRNNSTRAVPADEVEAYILERFGDDGRGELSTGSLGSDDVTVDSGEDVGQ